MSRTPSSCLFVEDFFFLVCPDLQGFPGVQSLLDLAGSGEAIDLSNEDSDMVCARVSSIGSPSGSEKLTCLPQFMHDRMGANCGLFQV